MRGLTDAQGGAWLRVAFPRTDCLATKVDRERGLVTFDALRLDRSGEGGDALAARHDAGDGVDRDRRPAALSDGGEHPAPAP